VCSEKENNHLKMHCLQEEKKKKIKSTNGMYRQVIKNLRLQCSYGFTCFPYAPHSWSPEGSGV
jgi:hypothetical protein